MVVRSCYMGYGVNMTFSEIFDAFELNKNELIKKKNIKNYVNDNNSDNDSSSESLSDYDSDEDCDDSYYHDVLSILQLKFREKNIKISGKKITIVGYNHTAFAFENKKVAVGCWVDIPINDGIVSNNIENKLNALFGNKMDPDEFKNITSKDYKLMTIADDCHCCS